MNSDDYSYSYSQPPKEEKEEPENNSPEPTYTESNEPQEQKESNTTTHSYSPSPKNSPEPSPEVTVSESVSEKEEPKPKPQPQQTKRKNSKNLMLKSMILAVKKQNEIIETAPSAGNYDDGKVIVDPRSKSKKNEDENSFIVPKVKRQRRKKYVYKEDKFHSDTDNEIEISLIPKPPSPKGKHNSSNYAFEASPSKYLLPNEVENHPDTMIIASSSSDDDKKRSPRGHGNYISEKTLFSSDSSSDVEPGSKKVNLFSYKKHKYLDRNKDGTITIDNDDEIFVHKSPKQQIHHKHYDETSSSKHRRHHHYHQEPDSSENSISFSQKKAPKIKKIGNEHVNGEETISPRKLSKFLVNDSDDNAFDFTFTDDKQKKRNRHHKAVDAQSNASNKPVAHDRSESSSSFFYEPRKNN